MAKRVDIILDNNKSQLVAPPRVLLDVIDHPLFCIKAKGRFYVESYRKRIWDGNIRYITQKGFLDTGKVPDLIGVLKKLGYKADIEDRRDNITLGDIAMDFKGIIPRSYQVDAVRSITENKLLKLPFPRGIISAATNAGKTLIMAMIHKTYNTKTLLLLNSVSLFNEIMIELPKLLPNELGWIKSGDIKWNSFMVVMAKTASNKIYEIGPKLTDYGIVLVDECELSTSKTYMNVLKHTYNSFVRVGLSGSALKNKDKNKNERLRAIFGNELFNISNKELMDKGFSTKIKIFIWQGNTKIKTPGDYVGEYEEGIIKSKERNKAILNRARVHVVKKRLPLLVIVQRHEHVSRLYKRFRKMSQIPGHEFEGLVIDWAHHERKNRSEITEAFKEGDIDILIGSYIFKRGINLKKMRALINAGGGDSIENLLQILGRATRVDDSKEGTVIDDFMDRGRYLMRHSKHRVIWYKKEQIKVIQKFDKTLLK